MKHKIASFILFTFLLTACSAQPPSPTAAPTATALPPTATLAPTATATPTEIPLPEGPIADLQKQIGDKFKITQVEDSKDTFEIKGMEGLRFNADGTAELKLNGETLTVAPQVILRDKENPELLNIGPWQLDKEGKVTMLVAGAPESMEDVAKFPKLAIDESLSKERQDALHLTVHKYVSMATEKRGGNNPYDPAVEFENVYIDGRKVESTPQSAFNTYYDSDVNQSSSVLDNQWNVFIAVNSGYADLQVFGDSGAQKNFVISPILVRNTDGIVFSVVGLLEQDRVQELIDLDYFTFEERQYLYPVLFHTYAGNESIWDYLLADEDTLAFVVSNNQELTSKNIFGGRLEKLPQNDLSNYGYWVFENGK